MANLIQLAGRLVRCEDDAPHQPLRCEAAAALRDASTELNRLQGIVEGLQKDLDRYKAAYATYMPPKAATAAGGDAT